VFAVVWFYDCYCALGVRVQGMEECWTDNGGLSVRANERDHVILPYVLTPTRRIELARVQSGGTTSGQRQLRVATTRFVEAPRSNNQESDGFRSYGGGGEVEETGRGDSVVSSTMGDPTYEDRVQILSTTIA
jgi:hypothetical protein